MSNQKQAGGGPLGKIKIGNAIYPILIGLAVVGWMLWRDFNPEVFADIRFSWATVGWLCLAVFFMFGRDIGYIIRIRVLSGGQLSWLQSFRVIMLWEFTSPSPLLPSGGTSVAIIYVHKEGHQVSAAVPAIVNADLVSRRDLFHRHVPVADASRRCRPAVRHYGTCRNSSRAG